MKKSYTKQQIVEAIKHWESVIKMIDESNQQLNEKKITDSNKLFFLGTTTKNFDVETQRFNSYKQLDKIAVDNAAFGTSTWEYACAYAKQYGTNSNGKYHGVVVAFELKPGIEVFDLRDENEYIDLGLPPQIANVFKNCEPYFAINTNIPAQQSFVVPPEFSVAKAFLKIISNIGDKKSDDDNENMLDYLESAKLESFPTDTTQLEQQLSKALAEVVEDSFIRLFGSTVWKKTAKNIVSTKKFNNLKEMLDLGVPLSHVYKPKDHALCITQAKWRKELKMDPNYQKLSKEQKKEKWNEFLIGKVATGEVPAITRGASKGKPWEPSTGKFDVYPVGLFDSNNQPKDVPYDEWQYRFKGKGEVDITALEKSKLMPEALLHNYKLLFAAEKNSESRAKKLNIDVLLGYMLLFRECSKYVKKQPADSTFKKGILRIKNRLSSKNDDDSKHVYIDVLQFTFFSMLCESNKYFGVTCPEIRGYANVHNFSGRDYGKVKFPYGYNPYEGINAQTMCYDDRTVILCKPLHEIITVVFGHTIDFIDAKDYRRSLKLTSDLRRGTLAQRKEAKRKEEQSIIKNEKFFNEIQPYIHLCTSVDDYKQVVYETIKKIIASQSKPSED